MRNCEKGETTGFKLLKTYPKDLNTNNVYSNAAVTAGNSNDQLFPNPVLWEEKVHETPKSFSLRLTGVGGAADPTTLADPTTAAGII